MNIKLLTKEALKQCMLTAIKNNTKYFLIQYEHGAEGTPRSFTDNHIYTKDTLPLFMSGILMNFDNELKLKSGNLCKITNFKSADTLAEFEGKI